MSKSKVLVSLMVLSYIFFVIFQFKGNDDMASKFNAVIFAIITMYYVAFIKKKTLLFTLFLVFYSLSELILFFIDFMPYSYFYYIGNLLVVFAYAFLLKEICKTVCVIHVFKNFMIHIIVLIGLNFYIAYILQQVVNPYLEDLSEYIVEMSYNIIMLLLLSLSLLNYLNKENKKALFLFLGALCIVFSEVINMAYLYVAELNLLIIISTTLFLMAFLFLIQQSKLEYKEEEKLILED